MSGKDVAFGLMTALALVELVAIAYLMRAVG